MKNITEEKYLNVGTAKRFYFVYSILNQYIYLVCLHQLYDNKQVLENKDPGFNYPLKQYIYPAFRLTKSVTEEKVVKGKAAKELFYLVYFQSEFIQISFNAILFHYIPLQHQINVKNYIMLSCTPKHNSVQLKISTNVNKNDYKLNIKLIYYS